MRWPRRRPENLINDPPLANAGAPAALLRQTTAAGPTVGVQALIEAVNNLDRPGCGSAPRPVYVSPSTYALIEQQVRAQVADEIRAARHRTRTHPATPDTYFWGVTTAERIARGDHP